MAATNSIAGLTSIVQNLSPMHFGGSSTKIRKRYVISFTDAANGIAVGGETHKINAADFGVGLTVLEAVSNLLIYTTSSKASVAIEPAVVSADGSHVNFIDVNQGTDGNRNLVADVSIASTQTGQLVIEGF